MPKACPQIFPPSINDLLLLFKVLFVNEKINSPSGEFFFKGNYWLCNSWIYFPHVVDFIPHFVHFKMQPTETI
jgi:hypothetical protein